jgi:predicted transcriptional regulator YheO
MPGHDEADVILRTLHALVEPLAALLPGECEVILHDLRLLPDSVVAVAGNLSGAVVGGPAPELLLREPLGTVLSFEGHRPDGRELRGSTLIVRDHDGTAVAALCINNDTASWRIVAELARSMLPWTRTDLAEPAPAANGTVDDVAQRVLAGAIAGVGVPVDLMQKRHKLAVVQTLKDAGFFLLREGVETAAQALGVTRFTIYNYLNEIE